MARTFSLLVMGIMLAGAVAGCIQGGGDEPGGSAKPPVRRIGPADPSTYVDKLSKAIYTEIVKEHVQVPSFDGKKMDNWVYRPKTDDATKVPVFINFSPYWSNLAPPAEAEGDNFGKYMIHEYVPRGYAVVLSSVRGTGHSEGCFNIGGDIEKKDAVAVIEHFAKQPWSNGNVAAGGKSYDGTTPQGAAVLAPEALKAIFPVSGISELYKYNTKGGISYGQGIAFNTYYYAGESAAPREGTAPPLFMIDRVACPQLPEIQANGVGSGATGDYTAYWTERNYTKDASKVKAAFFFVHGFTDWNVKPDNILPWLDALPADVPRKVWLHNWTGNAVENRGNDGHVYPKRDDFNVTMLRFLDETLKGVDTGIFDEPAFQIQDSAGQWRWEETWPPERAVPTRFFLSFKEGKGVLDPAAPARGGVRTFLDNGQGPGNAMLQGSTNFIRYESPVLEEDLHFAGVPVVHVQAASDRAVGKVVALLYDVGPTGAQTLIDWGGLNMRHRAKLESPQPVVPATQYALNIELHPQDDVVPAGHRLVLYLAGGGASFINLPYQSTISITENEQAFLELPVVDTFDYEEPQPVPIPCFTC